MIRAPQWLKRVVEPVASQMVYASGAYVDVKSTLNEMASNLVQFTRPVGGPADERLLRAARLISPRVPASTQLVRVGGPNDGGYVMADDFHSVGAISIGVGPDVSWDQDIARRGIPVAMFDPTIRRLPASVENSRFYRIGVSGVSVDPRFRPLSELNRLAGFPEHGDLLLKMDVEGAEWGTLDALSSTELQRFRQIVIELHGLSGLLNELTGEQIVRVLAALHESHIPIHVHANNYSRLVRFDNYWFPDAIEVTYLRRDISGEDLRLAHLPSELDAPCDPRVSDIGLGALVDLSQSSTDDLP